MAAAWGTLTELTLTSASLAAGSYRQSAGVDFGASPLVAVGFQFKAAWAATPTAGDYLELWWARSHEGVSTLLDGDASGTDSAYSAGRTDMMKPLGQIVVAATINIQELNIMLHFPPRYGALVILNGATSAALSSTEADCTFKYTTATYV